MASPAQEQRFRALASRDGIAAVARVTVGRDLVFVCRNTAGELVEVEVIDADGEVVELARALRHLAGHRRQNLRKAEQQMDALVALLAVNRDAEGLDLKAIASEADASRQTLYNRLERAPVAA